MKATAVIPVKRFAAAKQRLGPATESVLRADLAEAMLADVLGALGRSRELERLLVVSSEPRAVSLAETAGAEVIADPADAGHSEAASAGITVALASGAGCAALLPGDCPLLAPAELDAALAALSSPGLAVVPDRHGTGTNGLLLAPPDSIRPSFGPGSCRRHLDLAAAAGIAAAVSDRVPSMGLDLDTPEDLAALRALLKADPAAAPQTASVLNASG